MSNQMIPSQSERYFSPESAEGITVSRREVVRRAIANEYYGAGSIDPSVLTVDEPVAETPENPLKKYAGDPAPASVATVESPEDAREILDTSAAVSDTDNILTSSNDGLLDQMEQEMYVDQLPTLDELRDNVERARQSQQGAV